MKMKPLLCLVASVLFTVAATAQTPAAAPASTAQPDQPVTPYEEMVKSKPVEINGLAFVAAVQAQWLAWNPPSGQDPVEVQLLITNTTKKDLIFKVFDTFGLIIKDANGKEVPLGGGRDGTLRTKPVLIRTGDTYCLSRKASVGWSDEHHHSFSYADGTGSWFNGKGLAAGKYSLAFGVGAKGTNNDMQEFIKRYGFTGEVPGVWEGEGKTNEVAFEIVDPPAEK